MSVDRALKKAEYELKIWRDEYAQYGTRGTLIRKRDIHWLEDRVERLRLLKEETESAYTDVRRAIEERLREMERR